MGCRIFEEGSYYEGRLGFYIEGWEVEVISLVIK